MSLFLSLSRSHIRTLVPSIGSFFFHSFFLRIFLTLLQSKCIWIWVDVSVQFLFNVLSCDVYACAAVAVLVYASQIHAIILLLLLHWVYLHCNGVCVASGTYGAKFVHFVCMPFTISSNRQVHPTLCTFPFVFSFLFYFISHVRNWQHMCTCCTTKSCPFVWLFAIKKTHWRETTTTSQLI